MTISQNAKNALLRCANWNQGTVAPVTINGETENELFRAGLIGRHGGLTRKGSIETEKLKKAQETAFFGF